MPASLRLAMPRNFFRTVRPQRPAIVALRTREYLTPAEVERLMAAARNGSRYSHRDTTLILIAYRHGLRASEIADLEWPQVELGRNATLHVRRAKRRAVQGLLEVKRGDSPPFGKCFWPFSKIFGQLRKG